MTSADRPSARDRMIAEVAANFVTPDLREIAATIDGCEAAFARAKQTNSGGDGEGQRPVVARWQTGSPERLPTNTTGMTEAREAAAIHWKNKARAA